MTDPQPARADTGEDVTATTDTFTDAAGRRYIAGQQVPEEVWQRHEKVLKHETYLMAQALEHAKETHQTSQRAWEVTACVGWQLDAFLSEGWEPYGVVWVNESKFREKQYHLKRRLDIEGPSQFGSNRPDGGS